MFQRYPVLSPFHVTGAEDLVLLYRSCEKTLHGCSRMAADGPSEDGHWAAPSRALGREHRLCWEVLLKLRLERRSNSGCFMLV